MPREVREGSQNQARNRITNQYFKDDTDLDENSIIYTSGSGAIFKPGIPVGTIKKFGTVKNEIKFFSNLSQLNFITLVSFKFKC